MVWVTSCAAPRPSSRSASCSEKVVGLSTPLVLAQSSHRFTLCILSFSMCVRKTVAGFSLQTEHCITLYALARSIRQGAVFIHQLARQRARSAGADDAAVDFHHRHDFR